MILNRKIVLFNICVLWSNAALIFAEQNLLAYLLTCLLAYFLTCLLTYLLAYLGKPGGGGGRKKMLMRRRKRDGKLLPLWPDEKHFLKGLAHEIKGAEHVKGVK